MSKRRGNNQKIEREQINRPRTNYPRKNIAAPEIGQRQRIRFLDPRALPTQSQLRGENSPIIRQSKCTTSPAKPYLFFHTAISFRPARVRYFYPENCAIRSPLAGREINERSAVDFGRGQYFRR